MNNLKGSVIAVLGAGCAGLAAGLRLVKYGCPVVLIEKADRVGGLAGGIRINGNTYEYGPHAFHTTDPEILNDIKSLMGDELIEYKRTIKIKFLGRYFTFPLSLTEVFLKLPPQTVFVAGLSFLWHFIIGTLWRPKIETAESVLKRCYGNVLYKLFFKTYITSVWGIPPSQFSPAFARERIPRFNIVSFLGNLSSAIRNRVHEPIDTKSYVEKVEGFLYTTKQGFSLITQRMLDRLIEQGAKVHLKAEVTKLYREGKQIRTVEWKEGGHSHQIDCRGVINTLPINESILITDPLFEPEILQAARSLQFRALVLVGLVIRRPKVLPSSFMYFRQHSFNRISDLAQFGFEIKPDGSTILVAEISCGVQDRAWTDDDFVKERVIADLVGEHLIEETEVLEAHVFRARHAYPIYALHYEKHLDLLLRTVDQMANMETAGRQGRFQYINTHVAMKMGYEATDRLMAKLGELWGGLHETSSSKASED